MEVPKLQIRIENKKSNKREKEDDNGKSTLYTILFIVVAFIVAIVIYTFISTKEFRCERYAVKKADEKIKMDLSLLVTKTNPSPEDLEKIEDYKAMIEKNAYYTNDYDYYFNQCIYE